MALLARHPRVCGVAILVVLACRCQAPAGAQPIVSSEYAVKAAFLYNFAKFVEWPAGVFSRPHDSLTFCVLGEPLLSGELEQAVDGKAVQGRPVAVRHPERLEELGGCHILFVGSSEKSRLDRVFASIDGRPILTVGEDEGFRQAGGIINFVLRQQRVRFQIDLGAAERAGLKISSRLLDLAEVFQPGDPAKRK